MPVVADALSELDAAVFIDDMLHYIYQYYGISSTTLIANGPRNRYRQDAEYQFSPQIGDALLHMLRAYFNLAENIIEHANILSLRIPNPRSPVSNFMRCHHAAYLNDHDFVENPLFWCRSLLDYLVISTSLCIHFEQRNDSHSLIYVKTAVSQVLSRIMDGPTPWKINTFKRYAANVPNRSPYSEAVVYIFEY